MRIDRHKQKILAFVAALAALPALSLAAGGEAHVEKANNDIHNQASLQRGAKNFVNYCLACHSARYVRYNRVAADIGLTEQQMVENLLWSGESPHSTMTNGLLADAVFPNLGMCAFVMMYRALGAPAHYEALAVIGGILTTYWVNVLWGMGAQFYWEKQAGQLQLYFAAPCSRMAMCSESWRRGGSDCASRMEVVSSSIRRR